MARIALTCVLILITSELHQGVTAAKPKMTPADEVLRIDEGNELRIECQGEGKLHFSTQRLTAANHNQSEYRVTHHEDSGTYTFVRPHANRRDTGWYACAEEDIKIENNEQIIDHSSDDISWTYVYVDSEEPFAVMEAFYEIIPTEAGSSVVIPCRPTSPELPVILEINDNPVPKEYATYDPKIGFIINNVHLSQSADNYVCNIDDDYKFGDEVFPRYILQISDRKPPAKPIIDQDALHHVVWGEDLTLHCSITVSVGSTVSLIWSAPNSVPQERLNHSRSSEVVGGSGREQKLKASLTIVRVQENDGGNYTCTATDVSNKESRSWTEIKIWDPDYTYVNVSMDGEKSSISVSGGEMATWKIKIDAYPKDFWWSWYREDGTLINATEDDAASKYSHHQTGMDHLFRISKSSIEDSGKYSLHINTSHGYSIISLSLTVQAQPVLRIEKTASSYTRGQPALFYCHTMGSPLPNVTWSYVEFPDSPASENNPVYRSLQDITNNRVPNNRFSLVSRLNITINETGELTCTTCNEINCANVTEPISLADPVGFFNVLGPEQVVEGDNVTLICSASRLNFTDDIGWRVLRPDGISENLSSTNVSTKAMSVLQVEIINVSLYDAGNYLCRAECKTTGYKIENYTLNVLCASKPRIPVSNMNESRRFIKYSDISKNMSLTCRADGLPTPKVTWYKDEKLLDMDTNQYKFLDNNRTFHIRFFHAEDRGRYSCRAENRLGYAVRYIDIEVEGGPLSSSYLIGTGLICILILVIIIVITYMIRKVRQEKRLRKELLDAGLTHFREGAIESLNPELTVDEQAELLPYDQKWEFPREQLKLGKQLGSGAFGVVMKAEARGICVEGEVTTVAVKMVRRTADPSYMKALSSELKIMIHLGRHINVVNLLGACTKTILTKRELYVIVEYCRFGNLHNYLQRQRDSFIDQIDPSTQEIDPNIGLERLNARRSVCSESRSPRSKNAGNSFSQSVSINSSSSHDGVQLVDYRLESDSSGVNMSPDGGILSNNSVQPGWRSNYRGDYKDQNTKPTCTQDLLCWAWQVARGMEYLSSRNVLHGDLAARNILLADDNIVKICDFGLAKNMYKDSNYKKKGDGPLPIKWMAIESIRDRIFSTQSDVWSFGIVLWELFTLARNPYPGMEAEKQCERLVEGYRMEKPDYATKEIYNFMLDCWKAQPSARPLFSELVERIGILLDDPIKKHYFDLNTPYMNMNIVALQNGHSDYLTMMSSPNHTYHNLPTPVVEVHGDSAYVSMNRVKKSDESSNLSPLQSDLEESHFDFPPSDQTALDMNSDSEASNNKPDPMLARDKPYIKPTDIQPAGSDSTKRKRGRNLNGTIRPVPGYCDTPNTHPDYSNFVGNQSFQSAKDWDLNAMETELQLDNTEEHSPLPISGRNNRDNNIPGNKKTALPNLTKGDSFSNPSYVIMSNNKFKGDK